MSQVQDDRRRVRPPDYDTPMSGSLTDPPVPANTHPPVNGRPRSNGQAPVNGRRPVNGRPVRRPHPAEARTEFIPAIRPDDEPTEFIRAHRGSLAAGYQDPETVRIDPETDPEPAEAKPARKKLGAGYVAVRSIGEVMVTLGLVVLLFVVYEVWVTDIMSAEKQAEATTAMDDQWNQPVDPRRQTQFQFADGQGVAKLYVPALGEDYHFTIVEGTTEDDLAIGPGHYVKSALPGQPGNFAVAGHRVGKGAPFNDLDLIQSCDAIVVETQASWFVYRLLPTTDDAKNWGAKAADPACKGVAPQTGAYSRAVGRQIVTPNQGEVVAPVPGNPAATVPVDQRQKMITLTTCHPKFSNRQRMILQGILVREQPKNPADPKALPAELAETR